MQRLTSGHAHPTTLHAAASNDWVYEIKDMITNHSADVEAKDKVRLLEIVETGRRCRSLATPISLMVGSVSYQACLHAHSTPAWFTCAFTRRTGKRRCTSRVAKETSAPSRSSPHPSDDPCLTVESTLLAHACRRRRRRRRSLNAPMVRGEREI